MKLDSKIPEGPIAEKWTNHKNHLKLVAPVLLLVNCTVKGIHPVVSGVAAKLAFTSALASNLNAARLQFELLFVQL